MVLHITSQRQPIYIHLHIFVIIFQTHVKVLETPTENSSTLVILTVVLVACVLGILVAVISIYCFRQKLKIKQKLQGLSSGAATETEASADYQVSVDRGRFYCVARDQGGGAPSFVSNIDNSAMYDPAKLAGLSTDYVATPATPRRKGKLTEQPRTVYVDTSKNPQNRGKIGFSNAFFSKFLRRTSGVRRKKLLKITFCICVSKLEAVRTVVFLEIDEVILAKKVFLGIFHHWPAQ